MAYSLKEDTFIVICYYKICTSIQQWRVCVSVVLCAVVFFFFVTLQ
jgi:hypothetical protein